MRKISALMAICLLLIGCSTGPSRPTLYEVIAERSPPLVLRIASRDMALRKQWAAMSKSEQEAWSLAFAATNPGTLLGPSGVYLGLLSPPSLMIALLGGGITSQREKACLQEFESFSDTEVQKIAAVLGDLPIATIIEDELRTKLVPKGLDRRLEPITFATGDWSVEDFKETAQSTNSQTLIIGYIFLEGSWGLVDGKCGLKINLNVPLRAITVEPPNSDVAYQYIAVERHATGPGIIKKWIDDPELAREWMRSTLKELAARIANVYSAL
jgi:hypothetical protein